MELNNRKRLLSNIGDSLKEYCEDIEKKYNKIQHFHVQNLKILKEFPFVKHLLRENESLKAEIKRLKDSKTEPESANINLEIKEIQRNNKKSIHNIKRFFIEKNNLRINNDFIISSDDDDDEEDDGEDVGEEIRSEDAFEDEDDDDDEYEDNDAGDDAGDDVEDEEEEKCNDDNENQIIDNDKRGTETENQEDTDQEGNNCEKNDDVVKNFIRDNRQTDDNKQMEIITINNSKYYTNNKENGNLYKIQTNGVIGNKIGFLKNKEPFFQNISEA